MKWNKVVYDVSRGYNYYVNEDGIKIKRTHSTNMFTGKEMSSANQCWKIFDKDGNEIGYEYSLKDAKKWVEENFK